MDAVLMDACEPTQIVYRCGANTAERWKVTDGRVDLSKGQTNSSWLFQSIMVF